MVLFQILVNILIFFRPAIADFVDTEENLKCGNCMAVTNRKKDEVNFDCAIDDMAITFATGRKQLSPTSAMLQECLPEKYLIVDNILEYCCFWSPRLGCTQVFGKLYLEKYKDNCTVCAKRCGRLKRSELYDSSTRLIGQVLMILYIMPLVLIYGII